CDDARRGGRCFSRAWGGCRPCVLGWHSRHARRLPTAALCHSDIIAYPCFDRHRHSYSIRMVKPQRPDLAGDRVHGDSQPVPQSRHDPGGARPRVGRLAADQAGSGGSDGRAEVTASLQLVLLVLVAVGATGVVLIRSPVRQVVALSVYGLLLAVLFLAFQAPDVTLSELTVGAVVLPILLLLALAKVRERDK